MNKETQDMATLREALGNLCQTYHHQPMSPGWKQRDYTAISAALDELVAARERIAALEAREARWSRLARFYTDAIDDPGGYWCDDDGRRAMHEEHAALSSESTVTDATEYGSEGSH